MAVSLTATPSTLIEEEGTQITLTLSSDEPIPEGGLEVVVSSELENALGQFDVLAAQPENLQILGVTDNTNGFRVRLTEQTGTITLPVFDDEDADSPLDLTFSVEPGEGYTVDENAGSITLSLEDAESETLTPEPPTTPKPPETPDSDTLQVSLFTGPDYLIAEEGTVSAHAFLATNGVIPEDGLVVSVDAPNLSEFDLEGISVEGGEIEAVRDGGFDLRMTEYTTLVNLPIAEDGETESGETASFSLAVGEGYEIVSDYSSGSFELVDTQADLPQGTILDANDIIPFATDTRISAENPTFSGSDSIYFNIGNRYLNEDGTYTYIDYSEDVDVYRVDLNAGQTITVETSDDARNPNSFGNGLLLTSEIYDAEGNALRDYLISAPFVPAAPDKLFGGITPFDENETDTYQEFTAPEDGSYYIAFGGESQVQNLFSGDVSPFYDPFTLNSGSGNRTDFGNYSIEINLLTEDNLRATGTPTPPVSNPNVTDPPTLSLSANPFTVDSEGSLTNGVVERVEPDGVSTVAFTIQAEGEIPEEGIEFVLNSDSNLYDYVSFRTLNVLPETIGGQSLGAFFNEEGIPTGIRLRIKEPTMTVKLESSSPESFASEFFGNIFAEFEPLETDGLENVSFFLQSGEGYEIDSSAGTADVTYYDSVEDIPESTGGEDVVPTVGVTISETELIESEGTETTLTFTLSEPPPPEGLVIALDSENDTAIGSVLGQFDVLNAEISGGNFPVANGDTSGFFFTITEQTATIALSVFDELTVDTGLEPETYQEGIISLNFALQPQAGYNIDEDASEINFTIADNPDSQIQVALVGSIEADEDSNILIESEDTVSLHTFSLGAPPPEGGLTVSVNANSLNDFDLDAVEVAGGTITNLRDDGFDLTITEPEATIRLPILEDGTNEGSETATFTLEPGDNYEVAPSVDEASFILADTLDQISVPEEVEGNDTLAEANAIGLSSDSPSVSLSGTVNEEYIDPGEDVDLYSFNLEAGQTVSFNIDTEEILPETLNFRPVVFPAFAGTLQKPDTELRLFDAEGNELAANSDGAASDEIFSRDPFIEFTAEDADTYYIGVSALGNRNYDPNVARSGSGWTFPEIGVFFGDYELTASLVDGTTEFTEPTEPDEPTEPEAPSIEPVFGSLEADTLEVEGSDRLIFAGDADDLIDASIASEGANRIYGGSGDDTAILGTGDRILGGEGSDRFKTTSGGDNTITGGAGADSFWIAVAELPDAANTITDFTAGEDVLGIAGLAIGFEDVSITQSEGNTLIAANGSDLAILQGIEAASLSADSFAFA